MSRPFEAEMAPLSSASPRSGPGATRLRRATALIFVLALLCFFSFTAKTGRGLYEYPVDWESSPSRPNASLERAQNPTPPANLTESLRPTSQPRPNKTTQLRAHLACISGPDGRWIKFRNRPSIAKDNILAFSRCRSRQNLTTHFYDPAKAPGLWFAWRPPPSCPWESLTPCRDPAVDTCTFDKLGYCRIMHRRDLLVVGDSTHFDSSNVLVTIFSKKQVTTGHFDRTLRHVCDEFNLTSSLRYIRNDALSFNMTNIRSDVGTFELAWIHLVTNNSVLLLNRGAHFRSTPRLLPELRKTFGEIQKHAPHATIFFRATAIPSPIVGSEPLSEPLSFQIVANSSAARSWGWHRIHDQNIAVKEFLATEFPNIVLLDVEYFTRFRVDSRIDPQHSCIPGFNDWWVALFAHALFVMQRLDVLPAPSDYQTSPELPGAFNGTTMRSPNIAP
jgi:hypothetical protein